MARAPARALLAALLLLPAAGLAQPAPDATALDAAGDAARRQDWGAAASALAGARDALADVRRPALPPGALLDAALGGAAAAAEARDLLGFRIALAQARAGAVHAGLEAARASPGSQGPANVTLLGQLLDLERAGPELGGMLARLGAEPGDATLRDRAWQRMVDRVAEEARVALWVASVADGAGLAEDARERAAYAHGLATALDGEAARLPQASREAWRRGLSALGAGPGAVRLANLTADLEPLLLGVGLGRTIARLDSLGDEVLVAARSAEHGARGLQAAATPNATRLAQATLGALEDRYGRNKVPLYLEGEGDRGPLDANVSLLVARLAGASSAAAVEDAVERVRQDLRGLAHLTFGAFAKVEYVNVPRDRTVNFTLQAGRFAFEGLASWEVALRFDPAVARPLGASSRTFALRPPEIDNATGLLRLRGGRAAPLEGSGVLANLLFQGVGAPGGATGLPFAEAVLTAGDGRAMELFLLRQGSVTIALYDPDAVASQATLPADEELRPTNPDLRPRTPALPAPAALAAMALVALAARRRSRRGR